MLGRNLGNYHVVSQIGEGGMGVVYLARHVTLGRNAAVKVLRPELTANQEIVARFFNEARAATAVRHAGIIEVFDFGFLEDRSAYIIMEFLEGESLAARIRRGPLSISTALIVVRAIARALQAAHEHSIVHRDLKPDNIFLVPDADLPGGERIKLLDFGIAKLASVGETSHTRTGAVMGTPTYMAPEQCRGAGSVDHRADLYALGCVAYEMVCGTPPFVAEGVGDLIASHLHFQPEPLRARRLDVPVEVEALVLRLLQKDPQARPQSAGDVVQAIDRLVATGVGAAHSEPMGLPAAPEVQPPTALATTLSGMAMSPASPTRRGPVASRFIAVAGVATVVIAVVAVWARGSHSKDDTGPRSAPVAGAESTAPGAAPTMPASITRVEPPQAKPIAQAAEPTASSIRTSSIDEAAESASAQAAEAAKPPLRESAKPVQRTRSSADLPAQRTASGAAPVPAHAPTAPVRKPQDLRSPMSRTPEDPGSAASADSACTRVAFAAVVNADAPNEAAVQNALARLGKCKAKMPSELYADIQRQLITKL